PCPRDDRRLPGGAGEVRCAEHAAGRRARARAARGAAARALGHRRGVLGLSVRAHDAGRQPGAEGAGHRAADGRRHAVRARRAGARPWAGGTRRAGGRGGGGPPAGQRLSRAPARPDRGYLWGDRRAGGDAGAGARAARGERVVSFFVALQFLTHLPTPPGLPVAGPALGRALGWFPVVGLLLGALLAAADALLSLLLPRELVDVLLLALLALLTGGLHLDGFMDTCDGLFSLRSPAERLAIFRDSRVGSFGVVGAATLLLL